MLQLNDIKKIVSQMAGRGVEEVRVVVSPYRICPLGAHIDHQVGFDDSCLRTCLECACDLSLDIYSNLVCLAYTL